VKQPKIVLLNRKIDQPDTHPPSSPIPHPIFCGKNSIDTQDHSSYTPPNEKGSSYQFNDIQTELSYISLVRKQCLIKKNRSLKMGKSMYNFGKRAKEKARQQKQMDKASKRIMAKQQKANIKASNPNADSDIAEPILMEDNGKSTTYGAIYNNFNSTL
jgi:hypothetical protein